MIKTELIKKLVSRSNLSPNEMREAIEIILDTIKDAMANGERIEIRDFGAFIVRELPAKLGRNPKTGESVDVPSQRVVRFKAGKEMRKSVDA